MELLLTSNLPFGAFKNCKIKGVIDCNVKYMVWFRDNVKTVTLSEEVKAYIKDRAPQRFSSDDNRYYDYDEDGNTSIGFETFGDIY